MASTPNKHTDTQFLWGNLMMIIMTVIFGFNLPVQKLLIPVQMSAIQVAVCRMAGGCALFWIASLFLKHQKIQHGDWWPIIISGMVCLFGFMWMYAVAIEYSSVIDVSLVLTSQPIIIIIINSIFYHYRITKMEVVGVVLSLAGAVFVIISGAGHHTVHASNPILGDLAAVACSICYSVYICLTQKVSKKYNAWTLNKWLFLFAVIPALWFLIHVPDSPLFHHPDWSGFGELAFVVVLASFACYFMIPPSIRDIGSDLVGIYAYLTPVVATIIAVVMKLDKLRWDQPIAFLVIIAGVVLIEMAKRKMKAAGKLMKS